MSFLGGVMLSTPIYIFSVILVDMISGELVLSHTNVFLSQFLMKTHTPYIEQISLKIFLFTFSS